MTALEQISIREFARRDGCDEKIVRRKLLSGHIQALPNGRMDAALVGTDWRARKPGRPGKKKPSSPVVAMAEETLEEAAERLVFQDGRVFATEAEAKRHKESFLALMRELDYDRENASVVPVDDVVSAVAAEYALVRNRLLNIATRVAPRAAMLRSAEEVRALIDAEVALALQELSLDGSGDRDPGVARATIRGRFRKPH